MEAFKMFLARAGAEIFGARTDPWVVLRFRTGDGIATIHRNRRS